MAQSSTYVTQRTVTDLVSTPYTRIRYAEGTSKHLLISFSSIGRRRAEMPPDEFPGTVLSQSEAHCMFISDLRRSWMNDPHYLKSVQTAVTKIQKRASITRTTTLGLSLGAFSALVASALFPVTTAIAISPQFSLSPDILPRETRWRYWRNNIKTFRFETAEVHPGPDRSFVFHGLENDRDQMAAFEKRPNRDHFVFPDQNHADLGRHLKEMGVLSNLVSACAEYDRKHVAMLVKQSGGMWRGRMEKLEAEVTQAQAA